MQYAAQSFLRYTRFCSEKATSCSQCYRCSFYEIQAYFKASNLYDQEQAQ